jgi:hypothetical protein
MDAAVAGALIGVGGTAVGSLGSQYLTLRRDREKESHERQRARAKEEQAQRAALREALEGAAVVLRQARAALDELLLRLGPLQASRGDLGTPLDRWIEDCRANVFALMHAESILGLYLRDDAVLGCLSQALSILEQCGEKTLDSKGIHGLPLEFLEEQRHELLILEKEFRELVQNHGSQTLRG